MRAILLAATLVATSAARADSFEAQATAAVRIKRLDDLVWPLTATCDRGDDVQNRQCRQVRDPRVRSLAGATFLIDGEPGAFELGAWNAANKAVPFTLTGCIRCGGLEIDGKGWHVLAGTGGAVPKFEAGKLRGGVVRDGSRVFPDEASATAWSQTIKSVKVQLVVKVPDKRRWQASGKDGLWLELVAYRVIDPCAGSVLLAQPASGPAEVDNQACQTPGLEISGAGDPDVVTAAMVRDAMKPVVGAAAACFARLKVAGRSKLELTINADGSVAAYQLVGELAKTPTGDCITSAIKGVRFPRSKKPTTRIGFPIAVP
jgi:hypothetical protein